MYKVHSSGLLVSPNGFIKRNNNSIPFKGFDNGKGYLYVNIKDPSLKRMKSGKPRWMKKYVHIIVYDTYFNDYDNNFDVHHKNGVRSDNRVSNLQLLSRGDNLEEAFIRRNYTRLNNICYLAEEDLHL